MGKIIIPGNNADIYFESDQTVVDNIIPGNVSDGYHTFDELYEHRCLLFLFLCKKFCKYQKWKALKHDDGSSFEGYFIAGLDLREGIDDDPIIITYHLPLEYWDSCDSPILTNAPKWDGHTSKDVVDRMMFLLKPPGVNNSF
ncbi:hypothetical protein [Dolichospermum phage Dfl-JY23]